MEPDETTPEAEHRAEHGHDDAPSEDASPEVEVEATEPVEDEETEVVRLADPNPWAGGLRVLLSDGRRVLVDRTGVLLSKAHAEEARAQGASMGVAVTNEDVPPVVFTDTPAEDGS